MTRDTITLSPVAAEGLNKIGLGDFYGENESARMALVALVLPHLRDDPEWFPRGKWATIQAIGLQLYEVGQTLADQLQEAHEDDQG